MEAVSCMSAESLDVFVHHNPAFCALVLHWVCAGYAVDAPDDKSWTPWFVAIVGLMLMTPNEVRRKFPETANGSLARVFEDNPELALAVRESIYLWVDPFWRGVRYGVGVGSISISSDGIRAAKSPKKSPGFLSEDLRKRGRALGRLLYREGGELGVVTLLGVSAT